MEALVEALFAFVVVTVAVAVIVPATLCWLLVRQVRRAWRPRPGHGVARRATAAPATGMRLGRQWALLVSDATAARERFVRVVRECRPGPLHDSLMGAIDEVDAAVGEAQRLAEQADRTERAHRDVLGALAAQRRRRRRSPGLTPDLEASLAAATRAQHESAERLAAAMRRDLAQLQLLVARLHELTAHAIEISTTTTTMAQLPASVSVADRLAALRLATAEVEGLVQL